MRKIHVRGEERSLWCSRLMMSNDAVSEAALDIFGDLWKHVEFYSGFSGSLAAA